MTRIIWATILNRHRGKSERVYKPEDLITLSYDKEKKIKGKKESKKLTPEEVAKKFNRGK